MAPRRNAIAPASTVVVAIAATKVKAGCGSRAIRALICQYFVETNVRSCDVIGQLPFKLASPSPGNGNIFVRKVNNFALNR